MKGSEPEVCDRKVRWCVQDLSEKRKCGWMSAAAWYAGVSPTIECVLGKDTKECVHNVSKNEADVVVADIDLTSYARGYVFKKISVYFHFFSGMALVCGRLD